MNIAFVVRGVDALRSTYTTTHLAWAAHRRGHTAWFVRTRDLMIDAHGRLLARAVRAGDGPAGTATDYLALLQGPAAVRSALLLDALQVLFLRSNPHVTDAPADAKFGTTVLHMAELLRGRGVMVVNDPAGSWRAGSKLYVMGLPEDVRPRTLVATDTAAIKQFLRSLRGPAILKPMMGFGGDSVFYVRRGEVANVNQYIASLRREGYLIAQEYLPGARRGDKRLLCLDGEPLTVDGRVAIYKRVHPRDDIRNNMHNGGRRRRAILTDAERSVVARIAPKLRADGLYFVGLDLADGKVLEVNVWNTGGIHNINELYGIDVAPVVIADLEARLARERRVVELPRGRAS